jgi:hypothetical protein
MQKLGQKEKMIEEAQPNSTQWPPPLWMRSHFLGESFFSFFFFFSLFYLISSKSTTMGRLVDQSGHYNRTVSVWRVSSFKAKGGKKEGIGKGATNPSIQKARLIFLSAPTFHTHTHTHTTQSEKSTSFPVIGPPCPTRPRNLMALAPVAISVTGLVWEVYCH